MTLTTKIDYLNIVLILLSLAMAYFIPFELVLYAYAILGPLHYLTEIDWLKRKNFYVSNVSFIKVLVILAIIRALPVLMYELSDNFAVFANIKLWLIIADFLESQAASFLFLGVVWAVACVIFKQIIYRFFLMFVALFLTFILHKMPLYSIVFMLFLPTLIHNYFFTGFFMLYGALKAESKTGYATVFLLALVPIIVFANPMVLEYAVSKEIRDLIVNTGFGYLNTSFTHFFGLSLEGGTLFLSSIALKAQVFISFTYLYHYLNWFSKTSVIQWNKGMSKQSIFMILVIWAITTGIHFYDFRLGIVVLYFLALLHVFLELPLNVFTIKGNVQLLGKIFRK